MGHEDVEASLANLAKIASLGFVMAASDLLLKVILLEKSAKIKEEAFLEEKVANFEDVIKLYEGSVEAASSEGARALSRMKNGLRRANNRLQDAKEEITALEWEEQNRRQELEQRYRGQQ